MGPNAWMVYSGKSNMKQIRRQHRSKCSDHCCSSSLAKEIKIKNRSIGHQPGYEALAPGPLGSLSSFGRWKDL